jgi:hypothetical protein
MNTATRTAASATALAVFASAAPAQTTYAIDESQSQLTIVGGDITIQGAVTFPIAELEPGSFTAPLSGAVDANVTAGAIAILDTTRVNAVDHTAYLPGTIDDPATPAPGSFAVLYPTAPALGFDFASVTRDLTFAVEDAISAPLGPGGDFTIGDQTWTIVSGVSDLSAGNPPQSDLTTVAPVDNDPADPGTLAVVGDTETLTIPVRFTLNIVGNLTNINLDFEGTVVATRPIAVNDCPADFNNDGQVDGDDFGIFGSAFGSSVGDASFDPAADFTGDGVIDGADFGVFGAQFGRSDCLD